MRLTNTITGPDGITYELAYEDADSFDHLPQEQCTQVYGLCFCDGQLVIGFGGKKNDWGLIGGTIEEGETFLDTLHREIQEESNMKIITAAPIGYQQVINTKTDKVGYQLRYACIAEPFGEFEGDPDGASGITEIKLINAADYKQYFDWGEIGQRLIDRAVEWHGSQ